MLATQSTFYVRNYTTVTNLKLCNILIWSLPYLLPTNSTSFSINLWHIQFKHRNILSSIAVNGRKKVV